MTALTSTSTTFTVEDLLSASSSSAGSSSTVSRPRTATGLGRFCSMALHPIPGMRGILAGVLTGLITAGAWAGLTWGVVPASKHVTVQTPIGPHALTVAITRWPSSVAIGLGLVALLFAVAGVRMARQLDQGESID